MREHTRFYKLSQTSFGTRAHSGNVLDDHLDALGDPLRRRLLVNLEEHTPQDIPESVHEGERELETLRMELFHTHLPMLEEEDIVQWHRDAGEVVKGPRFDEIHSLVSLIDAHADELPYHWPEGKE